MKKHTPQLHSNTPKNVEIIKGDFKGERGYTFNTSFDFSIAVYNDKQAFFLPSWSYVRIIKDGE